VTATRPASGGLIPPKRTLNDPHRHLESKSKTVVIGFDEPFCVIGERINPTGRKKLAAELEAGDFSDRREVMRSNRWPVARWCSM
jgi:cobalamin-dependent methionine synthase I